VGDFRIDRCVIYATNITPDKETGIGNYTLAEFDNAVRRGVTRDGRRLYPAMPYPSYAKMLDTDVRALYDYFMDRRAMSFQGHPEFALDYAKMLIDRCQQHGAIKGAEADRARESLRQPNDCGLVVGWIRQFLKSAAS
jgi:hypothetical protein